MLTGTIKSWNVERGYGFAVRSDNGGDVFVHIRNVVQLAQHAGATELPIGVGIEFDLEKDSKTGRRQAANVRVMSANIREVFTTSNRLA